jgi:hypothetical protein
MTQGQDNASSTPAPLEYGQVTRRPTPRWVKPVLLFLVMVDVLGLILIFVVRWLLEMPWRGSIFMGFGSALIVSLLIVINYNGSSLYPPSQDARLHSIRFGRRSQ